MVVIKAQHFECTYASEVDLKIVKMVTLCYLYFTTTKTGSRTSSFRV